MPHLVQTMRDELEGPETKDTWLIHEAVEAPLQFTKSRNMIFQPRKTLLDSEELLFTSFEGSAGSWGVFVIIAMLDKEYRRPSRLRDAGSESFSFTFRICDRRAHGHSNETEPAFIVLPPARGSGTG
jgi:hypothetical protein